MTTTFNPLTAAEKMNIPPTSARKRAASPVCIACALTLAAFAAPAFAQSYSPLNPNPIRAAQAHAPAAMMGKVGAVDYAVNQVVARVVVEVDKDGLPADGVSANTVTVRVFDKDDKPIRGTVLVTIEHSAGRILLNGAVTDEFGPGRLDVDKVTPGVQMQLANGVGTFRLLAPMEPADVKLRLTAGSASIGGTVSFVPELRSLIAAGLIDGIIHVKRGAANAIVPTRIDDGFERELRRWTKQFQDGKGTYGLRSAFYVKGKISGQTLLTAAFDSDKDTNTRLLRDVDPDRFYPVYGDASLTGFDAPSRSKLFVRLDSGKSYALWGDFSTGDGFSQLTGGGAVASGQVRDLGAYNRSATGLRGHYETADALLNGFVFEDNLKQLVEEYRGNGTSGPFSVASQNGVENSEKIELITRDKNALGQVKSTQTMVRLVDYTYEPFSGRVLFKSPVPSIDANGDPVSIRITYESEQGGPKYRTYGIDGQIRLSAAVEVGGSVVNDENPSSPYRLGSANVSFKLSGNSSVVLEVAKSNSTDYALGSVRTLTPTGQAGETKTERSGQAVRLSANYREGALDGKVWLSKADKNFVNPAASVAEGRESAGLSLKAQLGVGIGLYGSVQKEADGAQAAKPARDSAALGITWQASDALTLDASLRAAREDTGFGASSSIAPNAVPGGGFFGQGNDAINPGTGISTFQSAARGGVSSGTTPNAASTNATGIRLAASLKLADGFALTGEIEAGSGSQRRAAAGANYQINERSKVYGRVENRTGLTSAAALNPTDRSLSFVAGIDNTFAAGPTVYSEFRLRDSLSSDAALGKDMQLGSGMRNTWNYAEGLNYTGGVEYLKILSGATRNAFAINGGMDYTADPLWKFSGRLEFRTLFDDKATAVDDQQDQYLSTLSVARKVDRDWTLLARNYALYADNHSGGTRVEDRFQIGAAWRPVDHNKWNALGRYEFKTAKDKTSPTGDNYNTHVASLHADYHPSRAWLFSGRAATKVTKDKALPAGQQSYSAWLLGGRATYDFSENWDVGLMTSYMYSPQGSSKQWAQGLELGYLIRQNLWLSGGANWAGFSDRDLVGSDYTNKGVYLRLRFKFDDKLFKGSSADVNRSLDR